MNSFDYKINDTKSTVLPAGLRMAFAQDPTALLRFTNLTVKAQDEIIERAKKVHSRAEMKALISAIICGDKML